MNLVYAICNFHCAHSFNSTYLWGVADPQQPLIWKLHNICRAPRYNERYRVFHPSVWLKITAAQRVEEDIISSCCWCQIASMCDAFAWTILLFVGDGVLATALIFTMRFLYNCGAGDVRHYAGCPQSGCAGDRAGKVGQKISKLAFWICASVSHRIMMSLQQKLHQERLVRDKVVSSDAFQWQSMLKSYWVLNENNEANAQMWLAEAKRGPVWAMVFTRTMKLRRLSKYGSGPWVYFIGIYRNNIQI